VYGAEELTSTLAVVYAGAGLMGLVAYEAYGT